MGIDIYAKWRGQSEDARRAQTEAWASIDAGGAGYLREAYHGAPYATRYLVAEAFATGRATIPAAVLKGRLPKALELVEERERKLYQGNDETVAMAQKAFADFVALVEAKEAETGEPVTIIASY